MKNNIFIISGPSGAGEDSVITGLRQIFDLDKIITTTTREKREGEIDGRDYFFVSQEKFREMIEQGEFFEWAEEDNGQLYGGTIKEIDRVKRGTKLCLWKIDYKGVIAAKKLLPEAISIFIYIPLTEMKRRLEARGHDKIFIKTRLEYAQGWFENKNIFDHSVENVYEQLEKTIEQVASIIRTYS
jgi:guanylate kinase